jgi:beta-phosphoglucomutase
MARPKALIFDMDGVLVNSEPLHQRDWHEVFGQFGLEVPEEALGELQGLRGEQVIDWLRERHGEAARAVDMEALILEKRRRFIEQSIPLLEATAGIDRFLRSQKGQVPLGLVTSARLQIVGQVLKQFNWRNIFDALVGAEHVAHPKPHPEPFEKAAERFRLRPSECLVFEDSAVGIQSARAAGCQVCAVTTTRPAGELRAAGAQWTLRDFEEGAVLDGLVAGRESAGWMRRLLGAFGGRGGAG